MIYVTIYAGANFSWINGVEARNVHNYFSCHRDIDCEFKMRCFSYAKLKLCVDGICECVLYVGDISPTSQAISANVVDVPKLASPSCRSNRDCTPEIVNCFGDTSSVCADGKCICINPSDALLHYASKNNN